MNPAKEMNPIRLQMLYIAALLGQKYPFLEIKVRCPWCLEYTLLLKEKNSHYWCMNCEEEGVLDELEFKIHNDIMQKKGVNL